MLKVTKRIKSVSAMPREKRKTNEYWMALSRTITGILAVVLQCITIYLILRGGS